MALHEAQTHMCMVQQSKSTEAAGNVCWGVTAEQGMPGCALSGQQKQGRAAASH